MKNKLFIRNVPVKNYGIVLLVSIIVILLSLYIRVFYLNYKENRKNTSVFQDKSYKQVNANDLDFALGEMSNAILYVSYTGDNNIYLNEKKIQKELKKNNLSEKLVYWNINNLIKNEEYLKKLKEKYPKISTEITAAPLFIYIKGGEAIEAMSSELKIVDYKVLNKLIDKYNIE